jgi:lipopolysaccharide cholinephosphotransferase
MNNQSVKDVQGKILEVMKFIDKLCRENGIVYYIMGGTALGAVRHGGFIPWDDDLDIFMTPQEYEKFKIAMQKDDSNKFVLQEWRTVPDYLEYAKVRMNGTTFIEASFKDRRDLHQGIYVDIMMLHKVPDSRYMQKRVYIDSKFVTLYGLLQRTNWKPIGFGQKLIVALMKILPCQFIARHCYKRIYKYDSMTDNYKYCYWITPAKFKQGLFDSSFFEEPIDVPFEETKLMGSSHIKEYLSYRYGDYMKLPSEAAQKAAVHSFIFDTEKDYTEYL